MDWEPCWHPDSKLMSGIEEEKDVNAPDGTPESVSRRHRARVLPGQPENIWRAGRPVTPMLGRST